MDLYVENVSSFVNDDDKLVTYKWLSKELEVHVNIAKEILQNYYDNNKDNVVATFLIKGKLQDGSLRMEVTRGSDLEAAKEKFTHLDFEHIYSVQKTLPDIELLATAGEGDVQYSAIKLEKCPLRKDMPCSIPEETKIEKNDEKMEPNCEDKKAENKPKQNTEENPVKEGKENKLKKNEGERSEVEKEKPKNSKAQSTKSNAKTSKKPIQSTKAGFQNLFGKVANQKKATTQPKSTDAKDEKKPAPPVEEEVKATEPVKKESPKKAIPPKKSSSGSKSLPTKKTQNKKRTRSPAKKEAASKRKRIVVASDSSEDEEMKSDHSENEEEPEEIIEQPKKKFSRKSPSPEPVRTQSGKVKIRKVVTQSYEDEDGYVLTKQVTVTEEVDAEPEPAPKPKKPEPIAKPKKQANIMSFFKRT